jgi:zinc protease
MKRFVLIAAAFLAGAILLRAAAWQPPRPKRVVLRNRAVLLLSPRPQLPMISMTVMVTAGSAADPADRPGLANFTAEMLFQGTALRGSQQFAAVFDDAGAQYSSRCDQDASYFTLTCLAGDFRRLAPVFFEALLRPALDSTETARVRGELLTSIRSDQDRPNTAGLLAFSGALYGAHPYGHPVSGDAASIASIGRREIAAFHRTWYRPNNCAIAVSGDFKDRGLSSFLAGLLASWTPSGAVPATFPPLAAPAGPVVRLIHRPISQSYVNLGFYGPSRSDRDYPAAKVMNYILGGGGFTSRLTRSIRVRQGLAYDVTSYFDPRVGPGPYIFAVQTKCASTDTAVKSLLAEMRAILADTVPASELEEAKEFYRGYFPFRFETLDLVNRQYLALELCRLDQDFYATDMAGTMAVTGGDVRDAARRLLDPARFVMTIVTDTTQTRINLPGATFVPE